MDGKQLAEAIAEKYGIPAKGNRTQLINRAVRTLPGGNELLDAIEATNAARNHAARHKATDRVIAIDAALDRFEAIRDAMVKSIMDSVQGA